MLKWGLENGCKWHMDDCFGATGRGHLEALKWMRSKGAPWDKDECQREAEKTAAGHPETWQWIAAQTTVLAGDQ